jgi:hypothetical protein
MALIYILSNIWGHGVAICSAMNFKFRFLNVDEENNMSNA